MNSDGSTLRPFSPNCASAGVCGGTRGYRYPRWSPDGTRLAYVSHSSTSFSLGGDPLRVHVSDLARTEVVEFSTGAAVAEGVDWSPDGSKLTFATRVHPQDAVPTIVISQPDGTGQVPVLGSEFVGEPTWRR